jgi:hypothetical protein
VEDGRVNEGDEDKGIWLMNFIYTQNRMMKSLTINYFNGGGEGIKRWR